MKADYVNLVNKMKAQLLELGYSKFRRKISKSPWHRIPAVSKVDVESVEYNDLLMEVGITKKLPRTIKFERDRTNYMNEYIEYQLVRLRRLKGDPEKFWRLAFFLLRRSVAFRTSAINHVLPSWWYSYSFNRVLLINRKVTLIFEKELTELEFSRKYIQKANGNWRPLGVPTDEWRVALHMVNNMLGVFLEDEFLPNQHAYIAGRGTMTAWREVLEKVVKAKYIYETDIKGFFDNVDLHKLYDTLILKRIPRSVAEKLYDICANHPKLPEELKMDESHLRQLRVVQDDSFEFFKDGKPFKIELKPLREARNFQGAIIPGMPFVFGGTGYLRPPHGVPQGAPTSPLLAILTLQDYLKQTSSVNYADDQIFYSDRKFIIKDNPDIGIIHAPEKCGWIRYNGEWKKDLKFLGLVYEHQNGTIRSQTRSEKSIGMHEDLRKIYEELSYNEFDNYVEDIAKRNFFGFVLSCLYNGSWRTLHFPVKERIELTTSWLGMYRNSRTMSSVAVVSLAINIRRGMNGNIQRILAKVREYKA